MRIIQVIGRSNSGKTTFNRTLCTALQEKGRVAALKHLGHHTFRLEEGKDSTVLFETGVTTAVGVDDEKSVMIDRKTSLPVLARRLADQGTDFLVIEGFKTFSFPAVVIGELESHHCLLKNPSVDEVLAALPKFPALYTIGGLIGEGVEGEVCGMVWVPKAAGGIGAEPIGRREGLIREALGLLERQGIIVQYQVPIRDLVAEQVVIVTSATATNGAYRLVMQAAELLESIW